MSELKAISSGEIYKIIEYEDCYRTDDLYYPKSEADKAIADKDKEIAELKEIDSKNRSAYYKDLAMMAEDVRHHKYKRCLAMAQVLEHVCPITKRKAKWQDSWHHRWLELAEKFKPNNSTAQ